MLIIILREIAIAQNRWVFLCKDKSRQFFDARIYHVRPMMRLDMHISFIWFVSSLALGEYAEFPVESVQR